MLSGKTNSEAVKERGEKYSKLKPENVAYTGVPRMNKQVWSLTNRKTHLRDIQAQEVQSSLLLSSIPIIKTIETLNEVREGRADVDLTEVIRTLTDSVALISSANVGLVTMRKALIKADLPDNVKPICAKDTKFTPELLFGEDLPKQVKDLGETTKLFGDLKRKSVQLELGVVDSKATVTAYTRIDVLGLTLAVVFVVESFFSTESEALPSGGDKAKLPSFPKRS